MIAGVIIGAGRGGGKGWRDEAERDGSWKWGCAGSHGSGDDEPGGVGEQPRCKQALTIPPFYCFHVSTFCLLTFFLSLLFLLFSVIIFHLSYLQVQFFPFLSAPELFCMSHA